MIETENKTTVVNVKKNGRVIKRVLDSDETDFKGQKILNMMDKSKCFDIFYDTEVDGIPMYEKDSNDQKLKYKFGRNNLMVQFNTLRLL